MRMQGTPIGFLSGLFLWMLGPVSFSADTMFYRVVSTQQTQIASFDATGALAWSNSCSNAVCRIESLPSLCGPLPCGSLSAGIECPEPLMRVRMPLRPLATPVVLSIYSDGWGNLMETWAVPADERTTIAVADDDPYDFPPRYYAYARQENCYTKLYSFTNCESVLIHQDAVLNTPFAMTGVIFGRQTYFQDHYLNSYPLNVTGPSGPLSGVETDPFGRYFITNMETGRHTLAFTYQEVPFAFEITNSPGLDYQDLFFPEPLQAMKPNIYLYPEGPTRVAVKLAFPYGGQITTSAPPYESGWLVDVDESGVIDGRHGYLFYEAMFSQPLNTQSGWLLDGHSFDAELRTLLGEVGLQGREIDDFVEYWLPILAGSRWYAFYPQNLAAAIDLDISPGPQSMLRVHFAVRGLARPIPISPPPVTPFIRTGFTVVEWGVIGWE